jgi:hypothetical protein
LRAEPPPHETHLDFRNRWRRTVRLPATQQGAHALKPSVRYLILEVAEFAGDERGCYASAATLAAVTGFNERTVRLHLAQGERLGWLRRGRPGPHNTSRWHLVIPEGLTAASPGESPDLNVTAAAVSPGDSCSQSGRITRQTSTEPLRETSSSSDRTKETPHEPDDDDEVSRRRIGKITEAASALFAEHQRLVWHETVEPVRNPEGFRCRARQQLLADHASELADWAREGLDARAIADRSIAEWGLCRATPPQPASADPFARFLGSRGSASAAPTGSVTGDAARHYAVAEARRRARLADQEPNEEPNATEEGEEPAIVSPSSEPYEPDAEPSVAKSIAVARIALRGRTGSTGVVERGAGAPAGASPDEPEDEPLSPAALAFADPGTPTKLTDLLGSASAPDEAPPWSPDQPLSPPVSRSGPSGRPQRPTLPPRPAHDDFAEAHG